MKHYLTPFVLFVFALTPVAAVSSAQEPSAAADKAPAASSRTAGRIYAQALVEHLFLLNHDLVYAEINGTPPDTTASVVIASSSPERVGAPTSPDDMAIYKSKLTIIEPKSSDGQAPVRKVRFPLLDGNDNMVGTVVTDFKHAANKADWEYAKDALELRNYLRRRIRFVSYLYEPEKIYSPAVWTPPAYKMVGQQFIDQLLAERQDIVHLGMHAKVPGVEGTVIVASSLPHRIGHPSGPYDTAVWKKNIVTMEKPEGEAQFEVCLPLLDAKDNILGTLLVEYKYYDASKAEWKYCKEALEIRDELKRRLSSGGDLINRAPDS